MYNNTVLKGVSNLRYRSVFLSDIHLGTRWCRAKSLVSFLGSLECDRLYLIGDIFDSWGKKRGYRRTDLQNILIRKVLELSKSIPVMYITGNHDAFMSEYHGRSFGGIEIRENAVHSSPEGKRYLVLHGHEFDAAVIRKTWLAFAGAKAYDLALYFNAGLSSLRSCFGFGSSSFSSHLKHRVKSIVKFLGNYDERVARKVKDFGLDGVICGHIHAPSIRSFRGIEYFNCGDWIESCSALVEHLDGAMEIVRCLDRLTSLAHTKEISLRVESTGGLR